jgi:hypothetical protein
MGPKRKSENISPPVGKKASKRRQKMSTGKNKSKDEKQLTQQNVQPTVQTTISGITSAFYYPNMVQSKMGISPQYLSQPINPTPVPSPMPYGQCNDILQSVFDRLDTLDKALDQINFIQTKVDAKTIDTNLGISRSSKLKEVNHSSVVNMIT